VQLKPPQQIERKLCHGHPDPQAQKKVSLGKKFHFSHFSHAELTGFERKYDKALTINMHDASHLKTI